MWLLLCTNAYDDITGLKSVDFTKTQKSGCLENEALFFLQIKKFINYISKTTLLQKKFCSGGNL